MKVLVTGANGFIGSALCSELLNRGHQVRAAVRTAGSGPAGAEEFAIGDIGPDTNWSTALQGQEAVIHLAARVHVMHDTVTDPLREFRRVNTEGTIVLAHASHAAGIQCFVFLSSIKVNGESTTLKPFTVQSVPHPTDPYAVSKYEAELGIMQISKMSSTSFNIIRPPLVYGPGAGGNFLKLTKLVARGIPLPLANVRNRRTMVSIWNLTDLVTHVLDKPAASTQIILAGDNNSISTAELIRAISKGMGKGSRLLPFPIPVLKLLARLAGKKQIIDRLVSSLEVGVGSDTPPFEWEPSHSAESGIARSVKRMDHA